MSHSCGHVDIQLINYYVIVYDIVLLLTILISYDMISIAGSTSTTARGGDREYCADPATEA